MTDDKANDGLAPRATSLSRTTITIIMILALVAVQLFSPYPTHCLIEGLPCNSWAVPLKPYWLYWLLY